ncbi:MAG: RSP_2648 family PIN domain-containing protein [Roseobacter sp.]
MKVVIDTCVLYPTVMREVLLSVARTGAFVPMWSGRILEEWARAARKIGPTGEAQARAEIAMLRAAWPDAEVTLPEGVMARLWLPDDDDIHVLAAAVTASAEAILTVNAKDFPRNILAEEGVQRFDPDSFLMTLWQKDAGAVEEASHAVLTQAREMSDSGWDMRPLLKKARLPRLAKALG